MSVLIAAILIFTLLWGEASSTAAQSPGVSVLLVAAMTLFAPVMATIQILAARRRHRRELPGSWLPRFRSMTIIHSFAWAITSLAMTMLCGWPSIVRELITTTIIPLADDLLLIIPALFSLITSWAVFIFASPTGTLSSRRQPIEIFSFWVRMRVILIVAPILFAFLVADAIRITGEFENNATLVAAIWFAIASTVTLSIVFYPRLLLWIWRTTPLKDEELRPRIVQNLRDAKLKPRKIHVWETGKSVANAAAVGIIPGTEVIVLSDLLLEQFTPDEVDAIVLHEIGHIRCRHCIKRIAMVLIPLALLAVDQFLPFGIHAYLNNSTFLSLIAGSATQHLPALGFVVYLYFISKSIFRSMEFEADRFAIVSSLSSGTSVSIDSALQKLAAIFPQQRHRRSGLHPSISERLAYSMQVRAEFFEDNSISKPTFLSTESKAIDPAVAK